MDEFVTPTSYKLFGIISGFNYSSSLKQQIENMNVTIP